MKNFFKNKKGMTYVELLVAFTLLVLIVFVFSPMLLSSYNTLYEAGAKTETAYKAKSEIEEGLAKRVSTNMVDFTANFEGFVDNINVKGRKVASTAQKNLETMFHGARASVAIISSSVVNDDSSTQEVIIQTTNIKITECKKYSPSIVTETGEEKTLTFDEFFSGITSTENQQLETPIIVCALFPNKTAGEGKVSDDENVYNINNQLYRVPIDIPQNQDFSNGRVKFTLTNCDFTKSPIKIIVYFRDEKGRLQNVSCYLYIKAPTIMAVGKTGSYDYYTTAGVETLAITAGTATSDPTFEVEGRIMPISNSSSVSTTPKSNGVTLKNVSFINNDADKSILDPYYVVTGTKGTIYRMYCFNKNYSDYSAVKTNDKVFMISDGTKIYPSLWGGDYTDQFGFSTYEKSMGYRWPSVEHKNTTCWYTSVPVNNETSPTYHVYSTQAKMAYMYNGEILGFDHVQQQSRRISYILTEGLFAMRTGYNMVYAKNSEKDDRGYNAIWENNTISLYSSLVYQEENDETNKVIKAKGGSENWEYEFAQVRIKGLTNLNDNNILLNFNNDKDKKKNGGTGSTPGSATNYLSNSNATNSITVTSALYDEGLGGMFYSGFASAQVFILQLDNMNTGDGSQAPAWKDGINGEYRGYYIRTNSDCQSSTVRKSVVSTGSSNEYGYQNLTNDVRSNSGESINDIQDSQKLSFFLNRSSATYRFPDFLFTLGYTSNREKVYKNITYNGTNENNRACEIYYFLSHYGDEFEMTDTGTKSDHAPNFYAYYQDYDSSWGGLSRRNYTWTKRETGTAYKNSYNNDYYNIWFPGECYTLTKTVTKEGITVAVGYNASGSVYQWMNTAGNANDAKKNLSTAVGGFFNDGVLAVKASADSSFTNVLYFKDNDTFDGTSLKDTEPYKSVYGNYGTHSRQSIQFTAVDLMVESSASGEIENKSYYAYYGDNTGRVFKSLVASANGEFDHYDEDDKPVYKTTPASAVHHIADLTAADTVKNAAGAGKMEEVTVGGKSISTIFSEIVSITAGDDLVVITGKAKDTSKPCVVVGSYEEKPNLTSGEIERGSFVWREVQLTSGSYEIQDGVIVNGYYYACGVNGTKGFILGADLALLKNTKKSSVTALICETADPLYSISGRA